MNAAIERWQAEHGNTCPLCRVAQAGLARASGFINLNCYRCGEVRLTREAFYDVTDSPAAPLKKACAASSFLRENPGADLSFERWRELIEVSYPTVGERAEKLLKAMSKMAPALGARIELLFDGDAEFELQARSWSVDADELRYLVENYLLGTKRWLQQSPFPSAATGRPMYVISPAGHEFLDSLRRGNADSSQGFCAMWFGKEVESAWFEAIRPAIEDAGYKPLRIDEHAHANRIDDEIIAQIRRSKFIVSDFTGQRGGVYFEAGFALGLGLPVIWTVRDDALKDVHFDNRQYNFTQWSVDDLPGFRRALTNRIVALLGQGQYQTR